jgi:hypothetical protein
VRGRSNVRVWKRGKDLYCKCCTAVVPIPRQGVTGHPLTANVVLLYCHYDLRVWKGKKMPGRLGNERMTFKNIWLWKVRGLT